MAAYAEPRLERKGKETKEDFLRLYKTCKDSHQGRVYHALYLGFFYSWKEVARNVGVDYETVIKWAHLYNQHGLEGLALGKPPGRQPTLSAEQLKELKKTIQQCPRELGLRFSSWTVNYLAGWIRNAWDVVLGGERIRQVLHILGFSYMKPRYRYTKADPAERDAFVLELVEAVHSMGENDVLLFEDETTVSEHPGLHGMWVLKGSKPAIPTPGSHRKRHVFGAVNPWSGEVIQQIRNRLTADAFVGFLKHMLTVTVGTVILVMDSSPAHTAQRTRRFLAKHADRIHVIHTPAYSPECNPPEHLWKDMKFTVTHNHLFETMNKQAWAIRGYFRALDPGTIRSLCSPDYLFG